MTTEDANQLLAIMKANYSYAFKAMSQEEKYMLLCTWTVTLQDLPTDIVMMAVIQLVSKSKGCPRWQRFAQRAATCIMLPQRRTLLLT